MADVATAPEAPAGTRLIPNSFPAIKTALPCWTRARMLRVFAAVVAVSAAFWLAWHVLVGAHHVITDDAYVGADLASVTPQVAGDVVDVPVHDTQAVRRGDVLVRIDPADARLAVAQASADYNRAVRRVRGYLAGDATTRAGLAAGNAAVLRARAQVAAAGSEVARTGVDLQRRRALAPAGDISGQELTTAMGAYDAAVASSAAAEAALTQARADRDAARGRHEQGLTLTSGARVDDNPEVAAASAALGIARLALQRTVIRASVDGMVARRRVQVGQRVAVGTELMIIVPLTQVYVDANFKEVQLERVRPGLPVRLTADQYGDGVVYHGRVVGIGGGSGAAFAAIPAQNATGNWIKVVQRLPVRIALDPAEVGRHPLRVGLSMDVDVALDQVAPR